MNPAKIILMTLLVIILIIIAVVLYFLYREPQCGCNVDPSQFQCSKIGKPIRVQTKKCKNKDETDSNKLKNILLYLQYMRQLRQGQDKMTILTEDILWNPDEAPIEIIRGTFYFAIDVLLDLLPTDFGQNKQTPYGIMSFFTPSFSCLSDSFCTDLFQSANSPVLVDSCKKFVSYQREKFENRPCPFPLSSSNSSGLYLMDPALYDELGLLGALSIQTNDVMVVYSHIPVSSLHLNYWSFTIYLADHVKPNERCYPFRQISASSLCPPLNMFNCLHYCPDSWTEFNPFLLDSVHVFTIISLNKKLIERVRGKLEERYGGLKNRVIHSFEIPSAPGVRIQDNLPNPNKLTKDSTYFDETYDRFVLFLRLSSFPDFDPAMLKEYIDQRTTTDFQTVLYRFEETTEIERCPFRSFPSIMDPFLDEVKEKSDDFYSTFSTLYSEMTAFPEYHIINQSIQCNNSILNIFAPLFKNIKNSTIPYVDGLQAFQMAGNAQADNHDAQYRTSKVVCISPNNVFLAFCINHSYLHNCIYNNINLVDYSKALSIFSTALDFSTPYLYYLVICARSSVLLDKIESKLSSLSISCKIVRYVIDPNINFCHPFLFVERVYLNTYLASSSLDLFTLYGPDLQQSISSLSPDILQNFSGICAPQNANLLKPIYMHLSYNEPTFYYSGILSLFVLFFLLVFFLFLLKLRNFS
jgi:hypothetical protein